MKQIKMTEEMEFGAYCLIKPDMIFKIADAGITNFDDYQSVMYYYFEKERKKYRKDIYEMFIIIKNAADRIMEHTKQKFIKDNGTTNI